MEKVETSRGPESRNRRRLSEFQLAAMERCFQQHHLTNSFLNSIPQNVKHSTDRLAEKLNLPEETVAVCETIQRRARNRSLPNPDLTFF